MEQSLPMEQRTRNLSTTQVMLCLWLGHLAIDTLMGFWTIHKTVAGLDLVKAGFIASVGVFLGNGMQIVFGYLGDRGWRQILLPLSMLLTVPMCLLTYTNNYSVLLIMVLCAFLGSAIFHPIGAGLAAQLQPQRRALMTSIFLTGGYLGYGLSQMLYAHIYAYDTNALKYIMILPILGCVLMLLLPAPDKREAPKFAAMWADSVGKRKTLCALYLLIVAVAMANIGLLFLLPEIMMVYGTSTWMSHGGAHMIWVIFGAIGLMPFGFLSDRIGPRQTMLLANSAAVVVMLLLMSAAGSSDVHIGLLFAVFGLCSAACHPIAVAYGNALMPKHSGIVSGVFMGGAWAMGGFGPLLLSWITADLNMESVQRALAVVLGLWFMTVLLAFSLPRSRQHTN